MNIYIGDPTLGLPVANFNNGINGLAVNRSGFGVEEVTSGPSFGDLLTRALEGVNSQQNEVSQMGLRAVTNPEEVSIHDLSIAMARANMSLNLANTIVQRSITAFREILTQR